MRSSFAAGLMGIGGIFLSYAAVVFVLEIFARGHHAGHNLVTMSSLGGASLVGGAILFALGFLLNRVGRRSAA
jgi:hypothetical protein